MDGYWLNAALVFLIVLPQVVSVIQFMRYWFVAGPIDFQPFERHEIPSAFQDQEEIFSSQFKSLGFHAIGSCRWQWSRKAQALSTVWIRDDITAEISIVCGTSKRLSAIVVAIGQEYMDDSSIVVVNSRTNWLIVNEEAFFLPGINEISKLDEIFQAIMTKRRGSRLSWVPADAADYKKRDIEIWRERVVRAGLYRLDSRRNRYWPTWKCLVYCLRSQWRNRTSFRIGHGGAFRKTNLMLKEIGYPSLEALRAASTPAFPVVANRSE